MCAWQILVKCRAVQGLIHFQITLAIFMVWKLCQFRWLKFGWIVQNTCIFFTPNIKDTSLFLLLASFLSTSVLSRNAHHHQYQQKHHHYPSKSSYTIEHNASVELHANNKMNHIKSVHRQRPHGHFHLA